jgi:hypothetical protein
MSIPNQPLHPAYFETCFRQEESFSDWPEDFAIITAYATTGETWTDEQNEAADRALEADLRKTGKWMRRLTGYSPTTGHGEPGWAVEIGWQDACEIGQRYQQHAIYFVSGDDLFVTLCDDQRELVAVGAFRERVGPVG